MELNLALLVAPDVRSNVIPFKRSQRRPRGAVSSTSGLQDSHTASAATPRPGLATSVLPPSRQQLSAAAMPGTAHQELSTAQHEPSTAQHEPSMAQHNTTRGQTVLDGGAAQSPSWSAFALHGARGSLRLARMITDAPGRAVKAARSAFVPFGQQASHQNIIYIVSV